MKPLLTLTSVLLLSACSLFSRDESPTTAATARTGTLAEIVSAGLLSSPGGDSYELGLTLANNSATTLWARVHFQTPDRQADCVTAREMPAQSTHLFVCPQAAVLPATDYPVLIELYRDIEQLIAAGQLTTTLRFD